MFLAKPGLPPVQRLLFGTIVIALLATSAAALNGLIEQQLDAAMARIRARQRSIGAAMFITYLFLMFAALLVDHYGRVG